MFDKKEVVYVTVLSICASYVDSDSEFDYWRGINGTLYGVRKSF